MNTCKICNCTGDHKIHTVREMMFGFRDSFEYFQCRSCGCLQIADYPADMERYYPDSYYSYRNAPRLVDNRLKSALKGLRRKVYFSKENFLRSLLLRIYRPPDYFRWLERACVGDVANSNILDIGCGAGHLLIRMKKDGYQNLTGIDPFIPETINHENGVTILKGDIAQLEGQFDFIMANHSLEHMPNQHEVIQDISRLLKPGKFALIRIPVVSGYAWDQYHEDWVNLDAPRHFYLHTPKSLGIIAEQAGLTVNEIIFDSHALQFWGSEQYRRDIPLMDGKSYAVNPEASLFSDKQIKKYKEKARELNANGMGDMACFFVYKAEQYNLYQNYS